MALFTFNHLTPNPFSTSNFLTDPNAIFHKNLSSISTFKLGRILSNFVIKHGKETPLDDILSCFEKDKENTGIDFQLGAKQLGICIQELFGNEIGIKKKLNKRDDHPSLKKITVYQNLQYEKFRADQDVLQIKSTHYGWCLLEKRDSLLIYNKATHVFINGNRLTIDLEIGLLRKGILVKGLNGNLVREDEIGIQPSDITVENVPFLLYFLSKVQVCLGFRQDEKSVTVIRTDNDPLCTKLAVRSPSGESKNIISKRCKVLICSQKLSVKTVCCAECSTTKKRLQNRKMYYENIQKTKNALLGKDDLAFKMKILQNEKRNACKKAQSWQDKFEAENYLLDEEDDTDLRSIFSAIDESQIPGGFELLMSQQKKALAVKGPSARRWHPK